MTVCLILQYSLVLVMSYDASLLDGFHFVEKLSEILFEGACLMDFRASHWRRLCFVMLTV